MLEQIKKEAVIEHAQQMLTQVEVLDASLETTMDDEDQEVNIWLISVDTGEEYWVLEGDSPMHMFHKGGINQTAERVYQTYLELMERDLDMQEIPDRFHQALR